MLPDELAGKLIKHIFAYVNDENPITDNIIINLAFEPIKLQLKRDLAKWGETKNVRSKAGLASAEAKKNKAQQNVTNSTHVESVQQTSTKPTVNVNDNVNDNVNVNVSVSVNDNVKNIELRKINFASTLEKFKTTYGDEFIKNFYDYWTEPNKSNTKFRQELEKTWSLERRIETWAKNDKSFHKQDNIDNRIQTLMNM